MDLPNFDGKRRHVYNLMFDKNCEYEIPYQPAIIYIDECQDLEKATMDVMRRFFPKSRFVLAGDIFQSIQKEPRESVLWYYTHTMKEDPEVFRIYMNETPRVPQKNLKTLQKALSTYYPEFKDNINNWKSSNNTSNADIEWRTLESYSEIFSELEHFCKKHSSEETMILTFSSAITVKGAMGDIARLRRFFSQQDITVNKNHKKMEESEYFLTTANSSKGLERDYVICFLTFPLEKAFINLSDDVVVNLITVALTRAKKKFIMYVPKYSDKFSRVLNLFDACPKPTEKIRNDDKSLTEYEIGDYLNLEHTVTELIRQSIIKYDTRIAIKENIKLFHFEKLFEHKIPFNAIIETEEERAFIGVLIENLITSTWSGRFPDISDYHIDNNPMYNHCSGRINTLRRQYRVMSRRNIQNIADQFNGIFCFSQLQMALTNKIVFTFPDHTKSLLQTYWGLLKPRAIAIRPQAENVKIQANMKMKLLTGVADTVITHNNNNNNGREEITIIEIKASMEREWKDDALTQAMLYALMSGKTWSRIVLLNPLMNEKVSYYFNSKQILLLRNKVYTDIMTFNLNCLLAKKTNVLCGKEKIRVENCFFLNVLRCNNKVVQVTLIRMVSPIKCEVLVNKYVHNDADNYEDDYKKLRRDKCQIESMFERKDIFNEVNEILKGTLYNQDEKTIVYTQKYEKFIEESINQQVLTVEKQRDKLLDEIESYDSLNANMMYIVDVFNHYRFI